MTTLLRLADLEAHDEGPQTQGKERRYLCPLSFCAGKQQGRRHRCFTVNMDTGAFYCHRCHTAGKLGDFWTDRRALPRANSTRVRTRQAFSVALPQISSTPAIHTADRLGTPVAEDPKGRDYLTRRGVSLVLATQSGVRYAEDWYGRPAVLFPMRDEHGDSIAANGRYVDGNIDPKTRTSGPVSRTVFSTPGALEATVIAITEAPIDALSLASLGLPSIAMVGTNLPAWLRRFAFERRLLIATDADSAGDAAASKITVRLGSFGAQIERLRPPAPCKDWNEALSIFELTALGPFIRSFRSMPATVVDPRADLVADTALWASLLTRARAVDDSYTGIFGKLLGLRCLGAGLEVGPDGVRLFSGAIDAAEYSLLRELYLVADKHVIRLLLGDLYRRCHASSN